MILATAFSIVYAAGLAGFIRPLSDVTPLLRLEPIIFLVLGYLFSRLPAVQNERVLREEIDRTSRKIEIMQRLKEQAENEREAVEEKIRNARIALRTGILGFHNEKRTSHDRAAASDPSSSRLAVETAMNILNS